MRKVKLKLKFLEVLTIYNPMNSLQKVKVNLLNSFIIQKLKIGLKLKCSKLIRAHIRNYNCADQSKAGQLSFRYGNYDVLAKLLAHSI